MWKILFVCALATGALAEYQVIDAQKAEEQVRNVLREQCKKAGAEDKVTEVENAAKNFVDCIKGLVDVNVLKNEIEEAKPNGALDEVFKKYCAKAPQLKTCIHNLSAGMTPCLNAGLKDHVAVANNGTDQLIDFVCYKDGDRIALFIAERGPECFTEKANAIRECALSVKGSISSVSDAKALTLNEQCAKFDSLKSCTVSALEGCSSPTPANMAESVFRFIRKGSPCKDVPTADN